MWYLESSQLAALARELTREFDVFAPQEWGSRLSFRPVRAGDPPAELPWNDHRLAESAKPFFFQNGKIVARWVDGAPEAGTELRPRALFGLKACDLKAIAVIDAVFRDHEFQEPSWCDAREKNLLIAGDCTAPAESCFCTLLGDRAYPSEIHDLALGPVNRGYVVEAGSEKGEAIIEQHKSLFREAKDAEVAERDARRTDVEAALVAQNQAFALHDSPRDSVEKHTKTQLWGSLAATCVQCNGCNMVCPTCHCFVLHAAESSEGVERLSMWDSCFHAGYARMAGGGTPRLQLVERFRNHYFHKFVSFPKNWGLTACSGCGRCIDACMGRIDKRDCLHRLETEFLPSEVLEEVL